jgi:ferritin-like metal-binding protein YciE
MPTGSETVPATELKEVLTHELGDLLYAERRILTMLKTMEREAADPELQARLVEHRGETEEQIERLGRAFEAIGEKAKAEKCPGIIGLKEEHDSYKREEKPSKPQLAAFDLGSGLRVEHYEIAAYRTSIAMATALGEAECARLLQESLVEEEDMARFLEKNAVRSLRKLLATAKAAAA